MANTENKATQSAAKDKRVEVFVPKGYANDDPNLLIAVNGVNYLLPRGKKAMVPDFVANEFYSTRAAQEKQDRNMEQMLEASK